MTTNSARAARKPRDPKEEIKRLRRIVAQLRRILRFEAVSNCNLRDAIQRALVHVDNPSACRAILATARNLGGRP